jgi:hypothetical protein
LDAELDSHAKETQATQAERAGVTETTGANTAGERRYADEVTRAGGIMTAMWRTEGDDSVCQICRPLNWSLEKDWSEEFRDGPPAHVNCRCWLEWHLVTAPEPSEN